jgi:hypothetical protein
VLRIFVPPGEIEIAIPVLRKVALQAHIHVIRLSSGFVAKQMPPVGVALGRTRLACILPFHRAAHGSKT